MDMARKSPVHFDGTGDIRRIPIQFVTVCTKDRRKVLANDEVHSAILIAWEKACEWLVGRYVIMPNHIHFFCAPSSFDSVSLAKWITFWKGTSTRCMPQEMQRPVWQKEYWDRLLRSGESYDQKWEYVVNNPVRAGLVSRAEDGPYAGELNELRWH